jgi:transposase
MGSSKKKTPKTSRLEYSPHKRARIATGFQLGLTPKALFAKEGVSPRTVHGLVQRYETQEKGKSKPRSGRPPLISPAQLTRIQRIIDLNPFILAKDLIPRARLSCGERTVKRALERIGIQHRPALRRPKLLQQHADARLACALKYVNNSEGQWERWIFSDESTVARGEGDRTKYVWVKKVRFYTFCANRNYSPPPRHAGRATFA